ncbi:Receptor-like serine/threonine-protein kinase SD1-8 [Acorus calamus]|uniref:Receptor-like serine/threonine-protein kinase n=1 Tax=Acorus calamus TaxID=4465 RepID=A0AAV9FKE2_ACOCL|nr:Receptor-like serine/threonine-protein kinase SD1-8 [Acorus calamus]
MENLNLQISITIIIIISTLQLLFISTAADNQITPQKPITVNQTIVSPGGNFALGFFNISGDLYVGIWYNNIPNKTIIWVANRDTPLRDPAGVFSITKAGDLAVLDNKVNTYWSSNTSLVVGNKTAATLSDTGNLVLEEDGTNNNPAWQSFDNPTDTAVPGMRLGSNSSYSNKLVSWKGASDPNSGDFSFGIDPLTRLQIITWRGGETYWRSHVWNGKSLSGARETTNGSFQSILRVVQTNQDIYITFTPTGGGSITNAMYALDYKGSIKMMVWLETLKNWTVIWSRPSKPCDVYNRCGPNGVCDSSGPVAVCKCFSGFEPKNRTAWDAGDWSGGCARRKDLSCDAGDGFLRSERMKLPDRLALKQGADMAACETECLSNCGCTAYAYANVTGGGIPTRCLVWVGDLLDLEQVAQGGEELHVRLVASELVNTTQGSGSSHNNKHLLAITLPTVASVLFLLGILSCLFWRRFGQQKKEKISRGVLFGEFKVSETLASGKDITEVPLLNFSAVLTATNNFSAANKLGEGGFGPVYMGKLAHGENVAVKRLSKGSVQGLEEFRNEVELIAMLQHTNLVRLLGWCTHEDEKILIYEYLPNKSLDKFIFDPDQSGQLDWAKRYHIIEGIAQGLLYLHKYSRLRIIHRDMKTSNVLLDGSMNPKISDFGLARIFGGNQTEANTERVVGTYGYMSPEYALNGLFSEKSDVFSFGVITLEIVTGKRSTGLYPYKQSINLLGYAWQHWEEDRSLELLDPCIGTSIAPPPQVAKCVQIGLMCVQEDAADRPTMSMVVSMLGNENAALPLPKQPAFAIGRNHPVREPTSTESKSSVNEMTNSIVEGR